MSKILLLDNNDSSAKHIEELLDEFNYEVIIAKNVDEAVSLTNESLPDIVLIDTTCIKDNLSNVCKNLKFYTQTNDIQILLLTDKNTSPDEILVGADGYITKPFNNNILIATINAHLRIKKLLDILYTNNSELAKSLYQLNVLYNTSSQFAGTLDKNRLIKIMNTGLEKSLKHSLCCTLVFEEKPRLIVNASKPISESLKEKIKTRIIESYQSNTGEERADLKPDNLKIEINFRQSTQELDVNILDNDSLFSAINVGNKPFGAVEIIRDTEFSGEDITCFQTVVKQVSLPLESAILYEEIKEKNIKLEKLERLKSEFISIVSHELRTPLTAIKSSIDIMLTERAGATTEHQKKFLSNAKRNVDRLSSIINDLLDLSKIEAGKMDFRFVQLDLSEPVSHVVSTFKPMAESKNITIETDILESISMNVYGDCTKLEQILSNLISNAVKFTPANGNIKVTLQVINVEDLNQDLFYKDQSIVNQKQKNKLKGEYIQVTVSDTGVGIAEENLHKVFDKFQQIESSLSREFGGTGLGLAIAKQLVEAHRGEIWVESELNVGSHFNIILPMAKQQNIFLLELDNKLQQAKQNHSQLALLSLTKTQDTETDIMQEVSEKIMNIFRKDDKSKFLMENNIIRIILSNTDKIAADNVIKRIRKLLWEIPGIEQAELSLGSAIYPDDTIEAAELIDLSNKNIEKILLSAQKDLTLSED